MSLTNKCRNFLQYFLPGEAISGTFSILLTVYTIVLSHLDNVAVVQALKEFEMNGTNSSLLAVTNAVLWICRDGSKESGYFFTLYTVTFITMTLFYTIAVLSKFFRPEFYCRRPLQIKKAIFETIFFNLAWMFLLFSINPNLLFCLTGQFNVEIDSFVKRVDFRFPTSMIKTHKILPLLSVSCFLLWIVSNFICFIIDTHEFIDESKDCDTFKDAFTSPEFYNEHLKVLQFDKDVSPADDSEDVQYKINRVVLSKYSS